jgi:NAD-dependent dihydropyrimidine dehydrogenase PreA subunit
MGIKRINYDLCTKCGICVEHCAMDVLRMDEATGRPFVKYIRDCQSCFLCEQHCPQGAIYVTPFNEKREPLPW